MIGRRMATAVSVALGVAAFPLAAVSHADRPVADAAAAPPAHTLRVSGRGVGMFPAFDPATGRYAMTTTGVTRGTVRVTATTSDPDGTVSVNGRPEPDGVTTVTGLTEGDEISVIISDSAGTAVHSLVYLPAGFPEIRLRTQRGGIAPGYVALTLTTWDRGPTPSFDAVVDVHGVPVWVDRRAVASLDLKRSGNGQLTVSRPTATPHRTGHRIVALDERLTRVAAYETVGLTDTDGHDSILRPDGSRILLASERDDETGRLDAVIQEVGPHRAPVFAWDSGDLPGEDLHAETLAGRGAADYAHINSVQETADGNLLVSLRHLSAVLKIDWRTDDGDGRGGIIWRLGGRDSDFAFVNDPWPTGPCAQHTATELPDGHILIFDNGSSSAYQRLCVDPADPWGPAAARPITRVTEYALDTAAGTATLMRDVAPAHRFTRFGGSAARLANGNTLLGWSVTRAAVATEVSPTGEVLWELRIPPADPDRPTAFYSTYRAAKLDLPDLIEPQVSMTSPGDGATYDTDERVRAAFACTDRGGSSLHSCLGPAVPGARIDTSAPGPHTFTVTARDGSGNTTTLTHRYTVSSEVHRPDVLVRRSGAAWVGDGVYGGASGQAVRLRLPRAGDTRPARARLQNDGSATESLRVLGAGGNRGFRVAYRSGGDDVTHRVLAGTWRTPVLAPGEHATLFVQVTRTRAARPGAEIRFGLRLSSTTVPTRRDHGTLIALAG